MHPKEGVGGSKTVREEWVISTSMGGGGVSHNHAVDERVGVVNNLTPDRGKTRRFREVEPVTTVADGMESSMNDDNSARSMHEAGSHCG